MFNIKQRRPMTQAEIDKSISLQSAQIKKDFNARLTKNDDELRMMIDHLIKLKLNNNKPHKNRSNAIPPQPKPDASFDAWMSLENNRPPQTAEVATAANSKDIDIAFYQGTNKNSSGDPPKMTIEQPVKSMKLIARQENYPHQSKSQVKERLFRPQLDLKLNNKAPKLPHQTGISPRQLSSNNKSILTTDTTRRQTLSTKRIDIQQTKAKKVTKKK